MNFPRQDSTTAQWDDLIAWAVNEGMSEAVNWLRGESPTISEGQYRDLCRMAVAGGCYDAHDRLKAHKPKEQP